MNWVERNRDHIEKIRAYVLGFQNTRPALFEWFQGGKDPLFPWAPESDRGTALLLFFCALYQNIGPEKLIRMLAALAKEYGTDLFRLNKLPFAELQAHLRRYQELEKGLETWLLWEKAPGILRTPARTMSSDEMT